MLLSDLNRLFVFSLLFLFSHTLSASLLDEQLKNSRVKKAYDEKYDLIDKQLEAKGLNIKDYRLMIKAYKAEQKVNLYVKAAGEKGWTLYRTHRFCWSSGELGPKRQQGDYQIPEGYYRINHFNPHSTFLLSLGISYPNKSDRIKSQHRDKGGAIYMHGGCATIGCIPIEDEPIKEVYILALLARSNGQPSIPIHIFPFEYSAENLAAATSKFPDHKEFWENLFEAEKKFARDRIQATVRINSSGNYYIN
jgi:murein L,D-transpeptidase YafK